MDRAVRLFWGAAVGALAALVLHPASRPYLLAAGSSIVLPRAPDPANEIRTPLPPPTDRESAALWLLLAAEKQSAGVSLSRAELQSLAQISLKGEKLDPDNAYFRQMAAVWTAQLGDWKGAVDLWQRAATLARWDDLQTPDLQHRLNRMAEREGGSQTWQVAYMYFQRSTAPEHLIQSFAHQVVASSGLTSKRDLNLRFATEVNGDLMRQGSRSIAIGLIGARIVGSSCLPVDLGEDASQRRLYVARYEFKEALRKAGMTAQAASSEAIFDANDGWVALTEGYMKRSPPSGVFQNSVLAATIPGAFVGSAAAGALIALLGLAIRQIAWVRRLFEWPWCILVAAVFGALTSYVTDLALPGAAIALGLMLLALSPKNERTVMPPDLGPLFSIAMSFIATLLGLCIVAFIVSVSRPAMMVLPLIGVRVEYLAGSALYPGLAALALQLTVILSPLWAYAQRLRTSKVLAAGLIKVGFALSAASIVLSIIACPFAVYADRSISQPMHELFLNEPLHYLRQ